MVDKHYSKGLKGILILDENQRGGMKWWYYCKIHRTLYPEAWPFHQDGGGERGE